MSGDQSRTLVRMPRLSLRLKLTMWIVAIFLFVYLSLALMFQLYQSRSIESLFNDGLIRRVRLMADEVSGEMPHITDAKLIEFCARQVRSDEYVCSIRTQAGEVIATTRRPGIVFQPEQLDPARIGTGAATYMLPPGAMPGGLAGEAPVRAVVQSFTAADGVRYLLTLGRVDTVAQDMHALVTRVILLGIPLGLIATGISAYIIAGSAVRPLSAISEYARQMSPESIGQKAEIAPAPAEVAAVQRELELARRRIEAGFTTQERFMSNVSHELKTPIAVILTELQTLKLDQAPAAVRDALKSVTEELGRLGRTVDSFLLLTRVRNGKVQIPRSETCLVRDVLLDSYASCAAMAAQHKVSITLHLLEGPLADAAVVGNCDLLTIIFDNIIRNAIRFSPAGESVTVRVELESDHVRVFVRDRGPGIPESILPRIFDRFAQAKEEERRGRGHGLGLEIAAGIAELHSGAIEVRNCDDAGCEFDVRLPLHRDGAEANEGAGSAVA